MSGIVLHIEEELKTEETTKKPGRNFTTTSKLLAVVTIPRSPKRAEPAP